jgi:pSer/pThr/pTyr-binding forkhead associated (FHA) protein
MSDDKKNIETGRAPAVGRTETAPSPDQTMALSRDLLGSAPDRLLEPALHIRRESGWERVPLGEKDIRIGHLRAGDNDLNLDDAQVSRRHAKIVYDRPTGGWFFVDLASTNGSVRNGAPVPPHDPVRLTDGDRLTFGATVVTVYLP